MPRPAVEFPVFDSSAVDAARFDYDLPWFPLWVADFVGSRQVRTMRPELVGAYILLLCSQWEDGPIPDDPGAWPGLTNGVASNAVRTLLERTFERCSGTEGTPIGWLNRRLEEVRDDQIAKYLQKVAAGHASGRARKRKQRNKIERRSNAVGTEVEQRSNVGRTEDERRGNESEVRRTETDDSIQPESSAASDESSDEGNPLDELALGQSPVKLNPASLVAYWIDGSPERPPVNAIKKQAAVAKRICNAYPRDSVIRAALGLPKLYPHSTGEPWDLFDLERKFAKAIAAANGRADSQLARFEQQFQAGL